MGFLDIPICNKKNNELILHGLCFFDKIIDVSHIFFEI